MLQKEDRRAPMQDVEAGPGYEHRELNVFLVFVLFLIFFKVVLTFLDERWSVGHVLTFQVPDVVKNANGVSLISLTASL